MMMLMLDASVMSMNTRKSSSRIEALSVTSGIAPKSARTISTIGR